MTEIDENRFCLGDQFTFLTANGMISGTIQTVGDKCLEIYDVNFAGMSNGLNNQPKYVFISIDQIISWWEGLLP